MLEIDITTLHSYNFEILQRKSKRSPEDSIGLLESSSERKKGQYGGGGGGGVGGGLEGKETMFHVFTDA